MLTKSNVIKTITKFPEHFSVDDLVDKMILLDKIEKGLQQAIALNDTDANCYLFRGRAYFIQGNKGQKACDDWNMAVKYGNVEAEIEIKKNCK